MSGGSGEWQRLDLWLWCARLLRHRADCTRLVAAGGIRLNRQPTDKAHARLRPGDVLTVPLPGRVVVLRVVALATRRGPAGEARLLYEAIAPGGEPCAVGQTAPYAPSTDHPADDPGDDRTDPTTDTSLGGLR